MLIRKKGRSIMKTIIETENLTKYYGDSKVLDNLNLIVKERDIVGLVGPNGAGKSTAMKIIMRLIRPTAGKVIICGEENNGSVAQKVGFASESPSFYNYLSGYDNLKLTAEMYESVPDERICDLIHFVGLKDSINKKVKTYSTGMKQRLGLARALLNKPLFLVLDEPTNGLDPRGIKDIYDMLKRLAEEENTAILLSSHQLYDIEKICNKVVMINQGKTVYNGELKNLKGGLEDSYFSFFQ